MTTSFHLTHLRPTPIYYIVENHRDVKLKGAGPGDVELITMHEMAYKVDIFGLAICLFVVFFSVSSDSSRL